MFMDKFLLQTFRFQWFDAWFNKDDVCIPSGWGCVNTGIASTRIWSFQIGIASKKFWKNPTTN